MKYEFLISILLFIILIYFFISNYIIYRNLLKYQRRFFTYSYNSKYEKELTYRDQMIKSFLTLIKCNSKILLILPFSKSIAKIYSKYKNKYLNNIDFLSIKFLSAITLIIVLVIFKLYGLIKLSIIKFIIIFLIGFLLPDIYLIIMRKRYIK